MNIFYPNGNFQIYETLKSIVGILQVTYLSSIWWEGDVFDEIKIYIYIYIEQYRY